MTPVRAFLDFWVALRGTVKVAAQRAGGRTRALAAGAALALLLMGGVTAIALVGGDGSAGRAGRAGPRGSDADAAALPVPGAGSPDAAQAGPAQPTSLAQPVPAGTAPAPEHADDETGVTEVPVTSGGPPVVAPDSAAGPDPGRSVTSTSITGPPTTATTTPPPESDGLLDALARLLGEG
jgi:hypothetical protein